MEQPRLAYRDHLTQLPNRIAIGDRIEAAVLRSRREGRSAALILIDIDSFKRVNSTLGHEAGDELLVLLAERLRKLEDPRITAGRYGGDEFVLLAEDLPPDPMLAKGKVEELGNRVLSALEEPFTIAGCSFEATASLGASIYPLDAATHHELVIHADQAMFHARRRGRAQMAMFDKPETWPMLELESTLRIRRALAGDELELFYQPVVKIADDGQLSGLEALLRWRDPDRGLVLPGSFLPFLEHPALNMRIAEWVVEEICRQMTEWDRRGFSPRVSFNVPARQLQDPAFATFVVDMATRRGVELTRLTVEITETSPVSFEEVMPTLGALRDAGIVLSLDDFGTGYSSLARLRSMPFTVLKTDRGFMHGVPGHEMAEELLEGIISLGRALGMDVVVEGVETADQHQEVLRLGGRLAQGYQLGRPAPPDEIEARWRVRLPAPVESGGR